ncbi:MAG: Holliday junction resolvase RuvX [Defluviitaleaceae bacterium]|nr:Holliday junction resolvase RuvX [Defluviitaleaceae bacterium]
MRRQRSLEVGNANVMEKFLGLDFGEKTIGVAVSHNGRVATGVTTLRRKDSAALRPCLKELKKILRENDIKNIVLGFPKNLDGEESARCAETLAFKEKLLRYFKNINVVLWDERLSTRAVSRVFSGGRKRKSQVDTMAAVYILQGFLDNSNRKEEIDLESFNEDDGFVVVDEDGTEHPLQILSSRENESGVFLLAIDGDEGSVYYFKCLPADDGDDDVVLEQIDDEGPDFTLVFEMFKDDYEEFGIEFDTDS